MISNSLEYINVGREKTPQLISECEESFEKSLDSAVDCICKKDNCKIVLLAGPSASGKTTTANKIVDKLKERGRASHRISLDDFYVNCSLAPKRSDGSSDYETVDALDLRLLSDTLKKLVEHGECRLPLFDFNVGRRSEKTEALSVSGDYVIVVEGLHALNPKISRELASENIFKMYISVSSKIFDNGKSLLHRRDLRFVRRLVRDYQFRNSSVENTYRLWKNVIRGEDEYLYPYRDCADIKINSIHYYEPSVFRNSAIELLSRLDCNSEYYTSAQEIISGLEKFDPISEKAVPEASLLREFLGRN